PRAAQELHLAGAEGREIVVQHELLVGLADERVDLLLVGRGPERRHDERLRLAAREERRAMRARQDLDLAGDRPDVGEPAPVEPPSLVDDRLAHDLLLQPIEQPRDHLRLLGYTAADARDDLVAQRIEPGITLVLARLRERDAETRERGVADSALELRVHARH